MIWALLAFLGVPIWLIVGILVGVGMARRKTWPPSLCYGRLVRDVLVLNRGAALLRTDVHAVDTVSEVDIGNAPRKPADAVGRLLTFDDGTRRHVAVARRDVALLDAVAGKPDTEA